jgi:hypothetical protein
MLPTLAYLLENAKILLGLELYDTIFIMPYKNKVDLYNAQKRFRIKIRENLFNYLQDKTCIDCGEADPIVLDFDHKQPSLKFKSISKMLSGHYSWKRILLEIDKCDIRCANCHRRKTYRENNFFGKTKPL